MRRADYNSHRLEYVRAQRAKAVQSKLAYHERIYDPDQFSSKASEATGCQICKYLDECKRSLWAVHEGEGLLYEPLRCFAEHPENPNHAKYKRKLKVRKAVQEVMELT